MEEVLNNVCYCICHENKNTVCLNCRRFHHGKIKPKTHPNDTTNPNIPGIEVPEEVAKPTNQVSLNGVVFKNREVDESGNPILEDQEVLDH